ncbi:queuosine salvage protein [Agrilus planipennis]|uniref:Queuosine 5'-phosphate N-glycosylase/hydrolase n=1 Tax=Agrilus planipennis TaxID=224129 RepID=A0A1W4XN24_AGRPL|nr:queuosine salvage protein [Agrilus planipennis]
MVLLPKDSAKLINSYSTHVTVAKEGIDKLGQKILQETINGKLSFNNISQNTIHPRAKDPWAVDWIFVVDSLNFCFWDIEHKKRHWKVDGQSGYFALGAAINRAIKEGVDILNPAFYATINEEQLGSVLRGDTSVSIPLLKERVKCLQESGTVLKEKYGGSFLNCIKLAEGSALKLLEIIINSFEHFRDECQYKGHSVSFYKRAQILVADVWTCHQGEGVGSFRDIDELTMFADYRVPQVLVLFGVLSYSPELMDILKKEDVLKYGSEMEVEIRGCSIHAVELLKEYVNANLPADKKINSVLIDHFLWDYRRAHQREIAKNDIQHHKCICIYY